MPIPCGWEWPGRPGIPVSSCSAFSPDIRALESRRPYYVPQVKDEFRFPAVRDLLMANCVNSVCVVPVFTAQRDLGGIHFGSDAPNAYSPEDLEFMEQVARPVAVAVGNALNFEAAEAYREQLSLERDRLRALIEVNNAVVTCLETLPLFQAISGALRRG